MYEFEAPQNYKSYDDGEGGSVVFIRRCEVYNRFVKADDHIYLNGLGELVKQPYGTCAVHGRINMTFIGFY